ncbi:zinc-dependent alcohol dehydrogenase [Amycolatopsis keratiniphila]|uniref:zinc-dependent alcohol dehydrogenase n=1 Tax=Amycolatopsis keratiniphila TaxID=129921 RepID=UPI00130D5A20|nr:zinc-binding dehydrogenase [Amycolatopsis keratiniphila]
MKTSEARTVVWDGTALSEHTVQHVHRTDSTVLEVVAAGICGTDLHVMAHSGFGRPDNVLGLGHEILGRVQRPGPATPVVGGGTIAAGDLVLVVPGKACGRCTMCLSFGAHEHLCPRRVVHGFSAFRPDGAFPLGGFSTEIELADDIAVIPVPEGMDVNRAVLGELVSVAVRGAERALGHGRPDIGMGTLLGGTAAVLGAGPVGAVVALVLAAAGLEVTVTETNEWRAKYVGEKLGLRVIVPEPGTPWLDEMIGGSPGGLGFDVVIECGGVPELFTDALTLARAGGRVVELGHFIPNGTVPTDPAVICRKDLEVVGSVLAPPTAYPKALRLLQREDLAFDEIVSSTLTLAQLTDLDLVLGERDYLKRVVRPNG